ncbi:hypothetical protein ASPSYDRAFT_950478 [Aspergillus sydowii CBS 593.65]|uniref:Uncharacterized protein n=1 Tax=Aspergillus sydowii CBS 593.65 TaxID=1036612 RepID=A0A1L9TGF3_9EURO|nr:uncharacterized protein ASPSYDRAFT_950478 [Aspergillus sydowii CBS 593.65]OJJ58492.1 hypothetical protein ASPSYDRAFT_950478 [Aspergillus sydowii CBS 593.65]
MGPRATTRTGQVAKESAPYTRSYIYFPYIFSNSDDPPKTRQLTEFANARCAVREHQYNKSDLWIPQGPALMHLICRGNYNPAMCIFIEAEASDTCSMNKLAVFERLKSGYKSRCSVIPFDSLIGFPNMQKPMLLYASAFYCCWSTTFAASETMQVMSNKEQKVFMHCRP